MDKTRGRAQINHDRAATARQNDQIARPGTVQPRRQACAEQADLRQSPATPSRKLTAPNTSSRISSSERF
jgi:hypothetical protein